MALVRIATRRSMLAMRQSRMVADSLCAAVPGLQAELVPIVTSGDVRVGSLAPVGGKGLFTTELENALREGKVDAAVHSAKDLPADLSADTIIASVPKREDPRDALVSPGGCDIASLPAGATVGTGSARRAAQLRAIRDDLRIVPIRGNVETRVAKALDEKDAQFHAAVLAVAGLRRSGLMNRHSASIRLLEMDVFLPAAGQGALAIQCLTANKNMRELLERIDDVDSRQTLMAERGVVMGLGADCHSCLAVLVERAGEGLWRGSGMAARPDGRDMIRLSVTAGSAADAGKRLLAILEENGAKGLMETA